jgi:SnoaL-like domain
MPNDTELLEHLYDRFNARDMAAVLATMHRDVMWANGMEGGHVYGHDGVRNYWTRQWAMIDPHVEPAGFSAGADGATNVEVHQTVRDVRRGRGSTGTFAHPILAAERAKKNPARWGSKGGANQKSTLPGRSALSKAYHRIRRKPSLGLKFNVSCRPIWH